MNKIKLLNLSLISILAFVVFTAFSPVVARAAIKDDVCSGVGLSSGGTCQTATQGSKSINELIAIGLNVFSSIVGIIAVVMIIVSGVKYMTSQGDPGKTNEAKNTILYAVIGLVIVAFAQVIVRFVLTKFT